MFKIIKKIIIFIIAAFTTLILVACVAGIIDPPTEDEQKAAKQQMQEVEEQSKLEKEQKKKEKEEKEEKEIAKQKEKKKLEKETKQKEEKKKQAKNKNTQTEKKKEIDYEKELEELNKRIEETAPERNALKAKIEPLIPSEYKEGSSYSLDIATPSDKSVKGYFVNIQLQYSLFDEESVCKDAAYRILSSCKDIDNINKIDFDFVDNKFQLTGRIHVENWSKFKKSKFSTKTLTFEPTQQ